MSFWPGYISRYLMPSPAALSTVSKNVRLSERPALQRQLEAQFLGGRIVAFGAAASAATQGAAMTVNSKATTQNGEVSCDPLDGEMTRSQIQLDTCKGDRSMFSASVFSGR